MVALALKRTDGDQAAIAARHDALWAAESFVSQRPERRIAWSAVQLAMRQSTWCCDADWSARMVAELWAPEYDLTIHRALRL